MQWNADQFHAVSEYYLNNIDETSKAIQREMERTGCAARKALRRRRPDARVVGKAVHCVCAYSYPRSLHCAHRAGGGRTRRIICRRLPAGEPHNRLALAKWTVSPENPLTARVTVNRMWSELFGAGLVETTEDFGIMGQRPSNPELLDWLAVEFRESGWNIKHMYKLMVMSAAYRQSAKATPEQLAKDPKNLLLAHGPRFRMDAEMLRDVALAVERAAGEQNWRARA